MKQVVIIGGGISGLYAYKLCNLFNIDALLIEKSSVIGGIITTLYEDKYVYDYIGHKQIKARDIVKNVYESIEKTYLNDIKLNTEVLDIHKTNDSFEIITNNNTYKTKYLVIATGKGNYSFNKLVINNKEIIDPNVIYQLDNNFNLYKNKHVVILGGGESAFDFANLLNDLNLNIKISLIHHKDQFRAKSSSVKRLENSNKANIYKSCLIKDIDLNDKKLYVKKRNELIELNYDIVLVQYGTNTFNNQIDFLKQLETIENKFVTNMNQLTNLANVYAIGDCTFYNNRPNTIIKGIGESYSAIFDISKKLSKYDEIEWEF